MTIYVNEHFLNFMDKYDRIIIDLAPKPLIITYTKDIVITELKEVLEHFYESLVGYCQTGVVCQENAKRVYIEKGYPYFFLYDGETHDSLTNTPNEFVNIYGTFGTSVGYTHHSLPYVKFKVHNQDGRVERYRMAVETTEEDSIQFYVSKLESSLIQMLKERYLYKEVRVPENLLNTYWWDAYNSDPYIPNDDFFGGSTKQKKKTRRRRTKRNSKRNSKRRKSIK
jgi:hypothetical protein